MRVPDTHRRPVTDGETDQIDTPAVAGDDGLDERAIADGCVVGVGVWLRRAQRVPRGVAGLHDTVDDLVIAAVPAQGDDQRATCHRCLPGQVAAVTGTFGVGRVEVDECGR